MTSGLEQGIDLKIRELVGLIGGATADVYFREAAAKYLIRELSWALIDPQGLNISQWEVADQLEGMGGTIRHRGEDEDDDAEDGEASG